VNNIPVKIKVETGGLIPEYKTDGAGCFDLFSPDDYVWETVAIGGGLVKATCVIDLKVKFEVPDGYIMNIYPRSGWGFKMDIQLANGTGKIDSDYRGNVAVKLITYIERDRLPDLRRGVGIAQAEIMPVYRAEFEVVDDLSETNRGEGGFGSTGHHREHKE